MTNDIQLPRLFATGVFAVTLSLATATGLPALGAGGGGGSSDTVQCNAGQVYDKQQKKCVQASLLDDETLTNQGRALALAGYYENALDALMAVENKDDATVLTYIGYAKRKMGKVDEGIAWYHKALAFDPDNLYTREYLGEGYIAAGRTDLAEDQLAKIGSLCGQNCEQYEALAAAIAGEPANWGG